MRIGVVHDAPGFSKVLRPAKVAGQNADFSHYVPPAHHFPKQQKNWIAVSDKEEVSSKGCLEVVGTPQSASQTVIPERLSIAHNMWMM